MGLGTDGTSAPGLMIMKANPAITISRLRENTEGCHYDTRDDERTKLAQLSLSILYNL